MITLFSSLLLLSLALPALSQETCEAGTFRSPVDATACLPCRAGTFSSETNASSCTPCPPGYFGFVQRSAFFNLACFPCQPGTFNPLRGATQCTPCRNGTSSGEGFKQCARCGPGTRVRPKIPMRDMSNIGCNKCPPGTFSTGTPTTICNVCPPGTTSRLGSSSCSVCPRGTYSDRTRRCRPCAPGTFNDDTGVSNCKICPPGTFSRFRGTSCMPCPEGTYAKFIASKRGECKPCPSNSTSVGVGNAGCKTAMGCPFGTFEDGDGVCKACPPGTRFDAGRKRCVPCADDEIGEGGTTTVCRKCGRFELPVDGFGLVDKLKCACRVGYQRADGRPPAPYPVPRQRAQCILCPPMTVGNGDNRPVTGSMRASRNAEEGMWEPECAPCPEGSNPVLQNDGTTRCLVCPENTIYNTMTMKCDTCPMGSQSAIISYRMRSSEPFVLDFIPMRRTRCIIRSNGCAVLGARNERCGVTNCPTGFFSDMGRCRRCMEDQILNRQSMSCEACPAETFSEGGLETMCKTCVANQIARSGECRCRLGQFRLGALCLPCPAGTFNPFAMMFRQNMCFNCPRGTFSVGRMNRFCDACPAGSVTTEAKATGCRRCPEGSKQGQDVSGRFLNRCVPATAARSLDERFMDMLESMTDFEDA